MQMLKAKLYMLKQQESAAKAAGIRVVGVHDDFFAGSEGEIRAVSDRYIMNFGELMDEPLS